MRPLITLSFLSAFNGLSRSASAIQGTGLRASIQEYAGTVAWVVTRGRKYHTAKTILPQTAVFSQK